MFCVQFRRRLLHSWHMSHTFWWLKYQKQQFKGKMYQKKVIIENVNSACKNYTQIAYDFILKCQCRSLEHLKWYNIKKKSLSSDSEKQYAIWPFESISGKNWVKKESLRCWLMRRMQISIKGHWNPSPVQKLSVTAIWFLLIIYHRSVKNCHNSFHLSSKIS